MFFFLQSPGAGDSGYVDSPPPDEMDSDGEDKINLDQNVGAQIGQDKGSVGTALLESALSGLPPRWRNWAIRGIFTWVMIGGFGFLIWGGPPILMLTVKKNRFYCFFRHFVISIENLLQLLFVFIFYQTLAVQVKCFSEIINIGYAVYRVHNLPWFRSLSW